MTSAQAFHELTVGRGRETDGLWLHRGALTVRGNGAADVVRVDPAGQLLVAGLTTPRLSPNGVGTWADSHLRIDQGFPSEPRIGFHESGNSAVALYKPSGVNGFRVRGNGGEDYPLVGAPGSVNAPIGQWWAPSGYAIPAINVWYETDVRASFTTTGQRLRIEWSAVIYAPTAAAGSTVHVGLGMDGGLSWPSQAVLYFATPGMYLPCSAVMYTPDVAAGPHRVSLFLYANIGGGGFYPSGYCTIWVTEQKA